MRPRNDEAGPATMLVMAGVRLALHQQILILPPNTGLTDFVNGLME